MSAVSIDRYCFRKFALRFRLSDICPDIFKETKKN